MSLLNLIPKKTLRTEDGFQTRDETTNTSIQSDRPRSVGVVRTRSFRFAEPPDELVLECGEKLGPITVAYETYGTLNEEKSNAILIVHALTGDAHAAGYHEGDGKPGWWDDMIGPGKGFDTDKYFVICSNVLGGCKGTTGPGSVNPKTGKSYGLDFPIISISDMVDVQRHLVDALGIRRLLSVAGGSMGGMQALEWMTRYPDRLESAIVLASAARHSPQQIAFSEVGRQAIMGDPLWKEGRYYGGLPPAKGLAVARMIGHITYMSEISMAEKFGRRPGEEKPHKFSAGSEVEDYLQARGNNFVKRFDANTYLYITRAIDSFDLSRGKNLWEAFRGIRAKVLVLAFKSDWLYPAPQSREIVRACKLAGLDTTYCEIDSTYGHDAFLLEVEEETHLVKHFLQRVFFQQGTPAREQVTSTLQTSATTDPPGTLTALPGSRSLAAGRFPKGL
jgi:homoserine O-acetyltransferase/O-succinyltransferase